MLKIVNLCVTDKEKKKFLFIKRNKSPYVSYWGMLGGKVEKDEEISAAASRELKEESGIIGNGVFLGKCHEQIFENNEIKYEFDIYFYHFIVDNFYVNHDSKEGELRWISEEEFEQTKLIPSDPLMIKNFLYGQMKNAVSIVEKKNEEYVQERFEEVKS